MKISKQYKHKYICCLPVKLETEIMKKVGSAISKLVLTDVEKQEAIENANCSKVCDLDDTIDILYVE